jgi:peptide deformylase
MILTPLDEHDPRLRQICATITKDQLRTREQQQEIEALLDFVYGVVNKDTASTKRDRSRPTTVGLSASQVGIMKQISVVDLSVGRKGYTDVHVLVNPKIVAHSKAVTEKAEGCVNFSSTWGIPRRWRSVEVSAWDRSGNELLLKLTGWPAILLQHEIDHLNGYLFIDRLPDPTKAHLVKPEDYEAYRKAKAVDWKVFVDVSDRIVA